MCRWHLCAHGVAVFPRCPRADRSVVAEALQIPRRAATLDATSFVPTSPLQMKL